MHLQIIVYCLIGGSVELGIMIGNFFGLYLMFGLLILSPLMGLGLFAFHRKIYADFWARGSDKQGKWSILFVRFFEFFFGFLNPAIYLLILFPALFDQDLLKWRLLSTSSLVYFGVFWSIRARKPEFFKSVSLYAPVRLFSFLTMALIVIHTLAIFYVPSVLELGFYLIVPSFLYVVPFFMAFQYFIRSSSKNAGSKFNVDKLFYFNLQNQKPTSFFKSVARSFQAGCLLLSLAPLLALYRADFFKNNDSAMQFVRRNQMQIEGAAKNNGLDPKVLASVLYTSHLETARWKPSLESLFSGIWASDDHDHFFLNHAFNRSIGPAQIKPLTAQTAILLYHSNFFSIKAGAKSDQKELSDQGPSSDQVDKVPRISGYPNVKEYRGVWSRAKRRDEPWQLPESHWRQVALPFAEFPNRRDLVKILESEEGSIRFCAFILGLYRIQWLNVPSAIPLQARPDILATLYQIGFERSLPKPNPSPSSFGIKVSNVLNEKWISAMF
jgi:hypothetical protein